MTNSLNSDGPDLSELFDDWTAQQPSPDFAARVVSATRAQPSHSARFFSLKRVVGPLFLAAFFLSFGALAAWDHFKEPAISSHAEAPLGPPEKARELAIQVAHDEARAEPEIAGEESPRPKKQSTPARIEAELPEPEFTRPRVVHYPSCECGTSGVVCTCTH